MEVTEASEKLKEFIHAFTTTEFPENREKTLEWLSCLNTEIKDLKEEVKSLEDDKSDLEDAIQDLEDDVSALENEEQRREIELDKFEDSFPQTNPIDEMKFKIVKELYKNCNLEILEALEVKAKFLNPNYISF